jgi:small subunit ribosomal protein S8
MAMNDLLSDMLARIRNGQNARLRTVSVLSSGLCANVLAVLKKEGFIRDFAEVKDEASGKSTLRVELKYVEGAPAIRELKRVSSSGRRVYSAIANLPKYFNGLGVTILSTPKGVLSDFDARHQNVGGEVLCTVF